MSVQTAPAPVAAPGGAVLPQRSYKAPIAYAVIALVAVIGALAVDGDARSRITVSTRTDLWQIHQLALPSTVTILVLGIVGLVLAALAFRAAAARRAAGAWLPVVFGFAMVLAFLVWSAAGKDAALPMATLLASTLVFAMPLVFGAMSGLLCERSGIINIAIEGQLLGGAFLAAVVGTVTGSAVLGMLSAPIAGALVGVLLALFTIVYRVDQIIVGVVLNVLVVGLTSFLFSTVLTHDVATLNSPPRLPKLPVPLLSEIPLLGPVLFRQTLLVYAMYAIVIVLQVMVFHSRWGLRMRAVGEHPKAADTVGIKVNATRWKTTILGGAVAGLGGAYFTVASGIAFGKEMTSGRGFIALAAMILGRWSPKGALAAALLFGFADALAQVLGLLDSPLPSQFLSMLPYVATIFAVAGLVGRVRAPAAEGIPYVK